MRWHESYICIKMRMESEFRLLWNGKGISLCDYLEGMVSKCDPLETFDGIFIERSIVHVNGKHDSLETS
jgi:hypothetical protein